MKGWVGWVRERGFGWIGVDGWGGEEVPMDGWMDRGMHLRAQTSGSI